MSTFLAESSSSPLTEVWIISIAGAGGIIVFIGLGVEKIADWMNNKFLGDAYKPHKTLEHIGWCILMFGIAVEIGVAIGSAIDAWDIRQMAIKNSPLNQPIVDISAIVTIKLAGTNFVESPLWGSSTVASLSLDDMQAWSGGKRIISGSTGIVMGNLLAEKEDIRRVDYSDLVFPRENAHGYILRFHPDVRFLAPDWRVSQKVKLIIDSVPVLVIALKFVPHNADLLDGHAEILINGNVREDFDILPQKSYPPPIGLSAKTGDSGFTMIAKNATLKILPFWMK